jgi:hypothetical protein
VNTEGLFRARVPIVLLLIMAAFLVASFNYDPDARALPVLVACVTIGLIIFEILVRSGTRLGRRIESLLSGERPTNQPTTVVPLKTALVHAVVWPTFLLSMIVLAGLLPAVTLYVFASLRVVGRKTTSRALATAVAVALFAWLLFEWGLSYELYRGVLIDQ